MSYIFDQQCTHRDNYNLNFNPIMHKFTEIFLNKNLNEVDMKNFLVNYSDVIMYLSNQSTQSISKQIQITKENQRMCIETDLFHYTYSKYGQKLLLRLDQGVINDLINNRQLQHLHELQDKNVEMASLPHIKEYKFDNFVYQCCGDTRIITYDGSPALLFRPRNGTSLCSISLVSNNQVLRIDSLRYFDITSFQKLTNGQLLEFLLILFKGDVPMFYDSFELISVPDSFFDPSSFNSKRKECISICSSIKSSHLMKQVDNNMLLFQTCKFVASNLLPNIIYGALKNVKKCVCAQTSQLLKHGVVIPKSNHPQIVQTESCIPINYIRKANEHQFIAPDIVSKTNIQSIRIETTTSTQPKNTSGKLIRKVVNDAGQNIHVLVKSIKVKQEAIDSFISSISQIQYRDSHLFPVEHIYYEPIDSIYRIQYRVGVQDEFQYIAATELSPVAVKNIMKHVVHAVSVLHQSQICCGFININSIVMINSQCMLGGYGPSYKKGDIESYRLSDTLHKLFVARQTNNGIDQLFTPSPELLDGLEDSEKSDVWYLGLLLFYLSSGGVTAFTYDTYQQYKIGMFSLDTTKEFGHLINSMLKVDPLERISLEQVQLAFE